MVSCWKVKNGATLWPLQESHRSISTDTESLPSEEEETAEQYAQCGPTCRKENVDPATCVCAEETGEKQDTELHILHDRSYPTKRRICQHFCACQGECRQDSQNSHLWGVELGVNVRLQRRVCCLPPCVTVYCLLTCLPVYHLQRAHVTS